MNVPVFVLNLSPRTVCRQRDCMVLCLAAVFINRLFEVAT